MANVMTFAKITIYFVVFGRWAQLIEYTISFVLLTRFFCLLNLCAVHTPWKCIHIRSIDSSFHVEYMVCASTFFRWHQFNFKVNCFSTFFGRMPHAATETTHTNFLMEKLSTHQKIHQVFVTEVKKKDCKTTDSVCISRQIRLD